MNCESRGVTFVWLRRPPIMTNRTGSDYSCREAPGVVVVERVIVGEGAVVLVMVVAGTTLDAQK